MVSLFPGGQVVALTVSLRKPTMHAIHDHVAAITNVFKKTSDLVPLHENVVSFFTWRSLRGPDRVPPGNNLATPI